MGDCCGSQAKIIETTWKGINAIRFYAGGYEALLVPSVGANLIELKNTQKGLDLLRSPENIDLDAFKARPQVYGIPVLFPPNRIEDGRFQVGEMEYNLPILDVKGHNFIHGFLRTREWQVTKTEVKGDTAAVEVTFHADTTTEFYTYFPHEFDFKILYTLSAKGLDQRIIVKNLCAAPLPMGLGFHTAFNVPFHAEGKTASCRMKVSVGEKWELSGRTLPTGKLLPLEGVDAEFRGEGIKPQGTPYEGHFTAKPLQMNDKEFNGAIIEDASVGLKLIYETGKDFKHWVIWNESGDKGFICPEPQTWAINAPNLKLPPEVTGFKLLAPGQEWSEDCSIYVESL